MIQGILRRLYNYGTLSPEKRDYYQKNIRDTEWEAIEGYIPLNSTFLDVGCGAGYNLFLARKKGCIVTGIDPNPYHHGVGRVTAGEEVDNQLNILRASAESLPFHDHTFDVLYSSHVLEHIRNKDIALSEFNRLLKSDGILIIGMPTATMAWINFWSQMFFNTHKRFFHVLKSLMGNNKDSRYRLINLFVPRSHSFSDKTIFYDLHYYRVRNWKKVVGSFFEIEATLLPALYPYPDFIQFFKLRKSAKYSSSVFFICRKK